MAITQLNAQMDRLLSFGCQLKLLQKIESDQYARAFIESLLASSTCTFAFSLTVWSCFWWPALLRHRLLLFMAITQLNGADGQITFSRMSAETVAED